MKASDLVIGREVKILRGGYAGYTGTIVNFDVDEDQVDVEISGTNKIRYLGINDIKLIDPFKNVFKKYENQNNKINMKNLVFESLDELFESKKAEAKSAKDEFEYWLRMTYPSNEITLHCGERKVGRLKEEDIQKMITEEEYDYLTDTGYQELDWRTGSAIEKFIKTGEFKLKKPIIHIQKAKYVKESLNEDTGITRTEEKPKKEDKPKPTNAAKEKAKAEKKKPVKVDQGKKEKYEQAIKGLEAELAKAKKPGAFKLVSDKKMKIQELQDKIKAWKKKLANLK